MKSLVQYIKENLEKSVLESEDSSKSFDFNFKGIENFKETKEQLESIANDKDISIETTEDSVTLKVSSEDCKDGKIDSLLDILTHFSDTIRKDSKNSSSESYAQLTKKFADRVKELESFKESSNEEPKENEEDNKEENKKEDE